jgi:hypothetical protein
MSRGDSACVSHDHEVATMTYLLAARVVGSEGRWNTVCCFDPTNIVTRLRAAFPDVEVAADDYALKTYKRAVDLGANVVTKTAKRDLHVRGPIWTFHFTDPTHAGVRGVAERYVVRFVSEEPISDSFRAELTEFLIQLQFASCVEIECVRLEGNEEFPI